MQGGIHPDLPGTAYLDLAREMKRRQPGIHLHAFSPMEIVNGSARTGLSFADFLTAAKEAGLDSVPGTAAEILDDDVRWADQGQAAGRDLGGDHLHRAPRWHPDDLDDDVRPRRHPGALVQPPTPARRDQPHSPGRARGALLPAQHRGDSVAAFVPSLH
ncbi:hypothetical protein [Trujillonella endophytica]|uniref:hypothetical protein n=1 Tax=Trujillonella endophytica TaxID=673521 RepID=UPI000ADC5971|nr:hypothetical protein [Trujillella endophytica]